MSKQIDLIFDAKTLALMDELKGDFNLSGKGYADVLRASLAIAKVATDVSANSDGVVLIYPKDQANQAVALNLRN